MSAILYKDTVYGAGGGGGGGASALADLTDVDLDNPVDGQIIKYDATNQKWVNANESGGGSQAKIDVLYDGHIVTVGSYELRHSINDYDYVVVAGYNYNSTASISSGVHGQYLSVTIFKEDYYLTSPTPLSDHSTHILAGYQTRRVGFEFPDSTHIYVGLFTQSGSANPSINKIYGVKL